MNLILIAVISLGAIALVLAAILYVASKKFAVYEDPRIAQVGEVLPQANCGGCGYPGCSGFADACVKAGSLDGKFCPVGGQPVMAKIADILGLAAGEAEVLLEILAGGLAPRHVDLVAALHPQDGLDQAVEIVPVGLGHLRGVVDEGVADGHLAAGPLHGDVHRLFGGGQEGPVELEDGQKIRVQRGKVFYRYLDASSFHVSLPPALFLS